MHDRVIQKACPIVLQHRSDGVYVLVFRHPLAGNQLPKGTVDLGETPAVTAVRELHEETGLQGIVVRQIDFLVSYVPDDREPALWRNEWHIFLMDCPDAPQGEWDHAPWGSPEEEELLFHCWWQKLGDPYQDYYPSFRRVLTMLEDHLYAQYIP